MHDTEPDVAIDRCAMTESHQHDSDCCTPEALLASLSFKRVLVAVAPRQDSKVFALCQLTIAEGKRLFHACFTHEVCVHGMI